jgi:diguanylate cyclase (GGDEF)-like protein
MGSFFAITLVAQAISSLAIGFIMLYFSNSYKQSYLKYWAWSFFMLAFFLSSAYVSTVLNDYQLAFDSPIKLFNVFILSLAGYSQVAFLLFGTASLLQDQRMSSRLIKLTFTTVIALSLFVTFFQAWDETAATLRYLTRIGGRYLIAGVAFIWAAVTILKHHKNKITGQRMVVVLFIVYGLEMLILSGFTMEFYIRGHSAFLFPFANYHGLFELMIYPMIAVGLVMWLLEVERERSLTASNILYNLNKTDGLTGLPNRQALIQCHKSWKSEGDPNDSCTLVLMGVDKLQRINDSEGIKAVDRLLILLSQKLEVIFSQAKFLGRLHGDIFAIVINGSQEQNIDRLKSVKETLTKPIKLENKAIQLKLSAGLVTLSLKESLDESLHKGNLSLQVAKEKGGNCVVAYDESLNLKKSPDLALEEEIRMAYKNEEFVLYFQPIWSKHRNRIVSFESLIRWDHPKKGILPPGAFLHGVMQMGQQRLMDLWVLKTVIKQLNTWQQKGLNLVNVSINISPETLETNEFVQSIIFLTNKYQIDKSLITIEVTENVAMKSIESGRNVLSEIESLGVQIAIDDFGTGYSSLNYLKTFPSDIIKFDRSFITQLQKDDTNHEILKSLVPLCKRLGKKVILEGIEDEVQIDIVSELEVDGFQGYYFSYPVNSNQAADMMKTKQISRAI